MLVQPRYSGFATILMFVTSNISAVAKVHHAVSKTHFFRKSIWNALFILLQIVLNEIICLICFLRLSNLCHFIEDWHTAFRLFVGHHEDHSA